MDNQINFEGPLEKLASGVFKNKTKIWMVLQGTSLMYYKYNKRSSCIGSIDVQDIQTVRQTGTTKAGVKLEIRTASNSYNFLAETSELAEAWVRVIHLSMSQRTSSRLSSDSSNQFEEQGRDSYEGDSSNSSSDVYQEIYNLPVQSPTRFGVSLKTRRKQRTSPTPLSPSTATSLWSPVSPKSPSSAKLPTSPVFKFDQETKHPLNAQNQPEDKGSVSPSKLLTQSNDKTKPPQPNATVASSLSGHSLETLPANQKTEQAGQVAASSKPQYRFKPPPSFSPPPPPINRTAKSNKGVPLKTENTEIISGHSVSQKDNSTVVVSNGSKGTLAENAAKTRPKHSPPPIPKLMQTDSKRGEKIASDENNIQLSGMDEDPSQSSEHRPKCDLSNGIVTAVAENSDDKNIVSDSTTLSQSDTGNGRKYEGNSADIGNAEENMSDERCVASEMSAQVNNANTTETKNVSNTDEELDISHVQMRRPSASQRNSGFGRQDTNYRSRFTDTTNENGLTVADSQNSEEPVPDLEDESKSDVTDVANILERVNSSQDNPDNYFSEEMFNSLCSPTREEPDTAYIGLEDNGLSCPAFQSLKNFLLENSEDTFDIDGYVCSTDSPIDALKTLMETDV